MARHRARSGCYEQAIREITLVHLEELLFTFLIFIYFQVFTIYEL